jgi:hypothetical protein
MIKKNKIPTIIGIVILLVGTFAGVFFLQMNQVFRIGASATAVPKDIRTGNLSDASATITWITEGATSDFVSWGETQGSLGNVVNESDTGQKFFTHQITLTGLKPETGYFYKINSDGANFDNNGVPWQFTSGSVVSANSNSIPVSGTVITAAGAPSKRALVYVTVDGYLLSTITSDSGNFFLQLASARSSDLKQPAQIDKAQTLLNVSVEAEGGETSSAQIFPQSANPIPALVLGQVQDYRNLQPVAGGENPNANLSLPGSSNQASKFDTSSASGALKPTSVILESIDEGETITTNEPQFFGKGPAGEVITISIHSEQIPAQTVKIPSSGSWSYSPTTALSPGPHSITISWLDATGITRTLTRNFVVQAGEVPAFVSSPSGSSPTPTPTIRPTIAPTATASPTPIPTLKPLSASSPSATLTPVPVTGDLTPTLLLSIMGIAVLAFSFYVWKVSEN